MSAYDFFRPYLFRMEAERAHKLTLNLLKLAGNIAPIRWGIGQIYKAPEKPVEAFGLKFKNPLGLAAGYDKDGIAIRGLGALGFGHVEIGTVTPRPQPGNPFPRVFRLLEDEAVINRMGFPSAGSEAAQMNVDPYLVPSAMEKYFGFVPNAKRNMKRMIEKGNLILGVNIGKNKETPNEEAALDYLSLVDVFARYADYVTVNVSSPNTAGLRQLQEKAALEALLKHIHDQRAISEARFEKKLPILVKLSPDLSEAELNEALEVVINAKMNGVIVTNTTLSREGIRSSLREETGGLSGKPLAVKSEAVLSRTIKRVNGQIPIVSAGGIMNLEDAKRRLDMGASLIQIYTGLIYGGPNLIREILRGIID